MKSIPAALQAHLDEGTTTLAWCWRIARSDGAVFGFTDHDRPLVFDGTTFEPESGLVAAEIRSSSDLSVDAQDAEGVLRSDRITETDILDGRWDNAEVEVWRANWQAPAQRVLIRRGAIGQIRRGRLAFVEVIAAARRWLGTPYHDQASVQGVGCDCLGLARGVWREVVGPEPLSIPPYSSDWGETGPREVLAEGARATMIEIVPAEAGSGALLLFRMRAGAIAKHLGILTERQTFIHAYEQVGVVEQPLTAAWRRRAAFAFLFPARES